MSSTLLYLFTLAGILAVGMTVVILVVSLFLWLHYRRAIDAAQQVEFLIETNTARPRPGMAQPDRRFAVVSRRDRGSRAG